MSTLRIVVSDPQMSLMISSFRLAKVTTILIGEYGLILDVKGYIVSMRIIPKMA